MLCLPSWKNGTSKKELRLIEAVEKGDDMLMPLLTDCIKTFVRKLKRIDCSDICSMDAD